MCDNSTTLILSSKAMTVPFVSNAPCSSSPNWLTRQYIPYNLQHEKNRDSVRHASVTTTTSTLHSVTINKTTHLNWLIPPRRQPATPAVWSVSWYHRYVWIMSSLKFIVSKKKGKQSDCMTEWSLTVSQLKLSHLPCCICSWPGPVRE